MLARHAGLAGLAARAVPRVALRAAPAAALRAAVPAAPALARGYAAKAAASEVSSILEQRIAGAESGFDVQETGRVLSTCLAPLPRRTLAL